MSSPEAATPDLTNVLLRDFGDIRLGKGPQNLEGGMQSSRSSGEHEILVTADSFNCNNVPFGNIRGLTSSGYVIKPEILFDYAENLNVFAIAICKSHLNNNVDDSELVKEGWTITRSDQKNRM